MSRFRPKAFFLFHYSESVYPGNNHPKKILGLEDPLCWMAFPQRQPSLRSEQVKFALGLKRPTITLTSVQTRFERQGKFLNFYELYEYFRKIFLFLSHIDLSSLIARRSVLPLKSREFFVHVRNESTIWTIWIVQKLWIF